MRDAVDRHARTVDDAADLTEAAGQPGSGNLRRERRQQGVRLSPFEKLPDAGVSPSATESRSSRTPEAVAMRRPSIARPSLTSSIAVAPASAAATPSASGGEGASCASISAGNSARSAAARAASGAPSVVDGAGEQQGESAGGEVQLPRDRDDVAGSSTGTQHGRPGPAGHRKP